MPGEDATPTHSTAVQRVLAAHVDIDAEERSHLAYFQNQTVDHLGGYLEEQFWNRLVLQLGTTEECVLSTTIAMGALHRDLEQEAGSLTLSSGQVVKGNTVHLYNKAVRLLKDHIANQGWQKLETTLVCCILCTGFEWLRGDPEAATIHLNAGTSILQQWQTQKAGGPSYWSPAGHLIRGKLAPFYTRLALQSYTVIDRTLPWPNLRTTNTTIEPFQSIQHARDSLCNLLAEVYLVPETNELLRRRTPRSERERARFEASLAQWSEADASYHHDSLAHPTCATMLLANITPRTPSSPLDTTAAFEYVLDLAHDLLSWSNTSRFSIDLGLVAPLVYVVEYCPQAEIRQKALEFLAKHKIHEGGWSSQAAVRKARLADAATEGAWVGEVRSW